MDEAQKLICWTYHNNQSGPAYVAQMPGDGGACWGYTNRVEGNNGYDKALHMTHRQWQRFAKCMRETGRQAICCPASIEAR